MDNKKYLNPQDHVLASSVTRPKRLHEVTIFNVQQPLAASTAERKYERKQRPNTYRDSDEFEDLAKVAASNSFFTPPTSQSSSLGILDMDKVAPLTEMRRSSRDLTEERQLAKTLLQTCNRSGSRPSSSGSKKFTAQNFHFEPRDVQSRSSGVSSSSQQSVQDRSWYSSGISMSESLAERLNQYVDCDFINLNEATDQLQPDKDLFHQIDVPAIPEFDSTDDLAEIIQNFDLSELEENARKSMSFSEYCKQKSGNFGTLEDNTICRASLGLGSIESPAKNSNSRRLADVTMESEVLEKTTSEAANLKDMTILTTYTEETGEIYHVNLTSIANVINFEGKTPRSVVDDLLNMNKRKSTRPRETYLLQDPKRKETANPKQLREQRSMSDGFQDRLPQREFRGSSQTHNRSISNDEASRTSSQSATLTNPSGRDVRTSSQSATLTNTSTNNRSQNNHTDFDDNELSTSRQDTAFMRNVSFNSDGSIKVSNMQDVTTCKLGIPKIHEIEINNGSEKWVLVSPKLAEDQESNSKIKLEIPEETGLMKPGDSKIIQVVATLFEQCEPIKVKLNLSMSDMVTKGTWQMYHSFYLVGEECKINLSESKELAFGEVAEKGCKILPLRIDNENSIGVYVEFQILQNDKSAFYINQSDNGNSLKINLSPRESRSIQIQFHGIDLRFLKDSNKTNDLLYCAKSILLVKVYTDELVLQKEITLGGFVGVTDINLCNVQLPIIVDQKQHTKIVVGNFGTVGTTARATVESNETSNKNFVVFPSKFSLGSGEKTQLTIAYNPQITGKRENQVLLKITTPNGAKSFPVVIQEEIEKQLENEVQKGNSSKNSQTSNNSHCNGSLESGTSSTRTVKEYLPIKATHIAVVWGCVKMNKKDGKEFSIRNMSDSKLKLLASIESSQKTFKFYREGYGSSSSIAFTLHSNETKTLSTTFEPLKPGPHSGKIIFQHYSRSRQSTENSPIKIILLNGFCGHGSLEIPRVFRDPTGQMWMNLGKLNNLGYLETEIQIRNIGDLTCFAKIELIPKSISSSQTSWEITPNQFMMEPKQVRNIRVYFKPRKAELDKVRQVYTAQIGTLKIIHGDEPTRLRIRRIYNRAASAGQNVATDRAFNNYVVSLVKDFPGESPVDLGDIRDSSTNLNDLCSEIREYELHLTMDMKTDDTESILNETLDATFHTLINDTHEVTVFHQDRRK